MFVKILLLNLFISAAFAKEISQRIIGGEPANAGQYPFAAAIYVTTSTGRFFCGGTLFNNQWVITAGQCVNEAVLFTIQLGSTSLNEADENRLTLATSEYVLHPEFNPATLEHDLGLIKFRMPIQFTDYIQPIFTLPGNPMRPEYVILAIGWGQLSDDHGELSEHLNWARVTTITNEECRITYGNQIADNMLCVAGDYNEGACIGDTGSPVVELIKMGNGCLTGIASFVSANGCESTDPSGYTRVFEYRDWIRNVTSNE